MKGRTFVIFTLIIAALTLCLGARSAHAWASGSQRASNTILRKAVISNDENSLTVTKQVTGKGDPDKEFWFTISFIGDVPNPIVYTINGSISYILDADGRFALKGGERAAFLNIPPGTRYKIVEDDYAAESYLAETQSYEGSVTREGLTLEFINHFQPTPPARDDGFISMEKIVTGDGADTSQYFTFNVAFTTPAGDPLPGPIMYIYASDTTTAMELPASGQVSLKHNESILFQGLPNGTRYTVTETPAKGYIAAKEVVSGTIIAPATVEISFINERELADLHIKKVVKGEIPARFADKTYDFRVKIDDSSTEFTLKDGETYTVRNIPAGAVFEVIENDYSSERFVTTIDNASGTIDGADVEVTVINTYLGDEEVTISGEKTWDLNGKSPALPEYIDVALKNGNTIVDTQRVSPDPSNGGRWIYEWSVPKYEADGVMQIKYSLEETPIYGWQSFINGFDIRNVYVYAEPPSTDIGTTDAPDPTPSAPQNTPTAPQNTPIFAPTPAQTPVPTLALTPTPSPTPSPTPMMTLRPIGAGLGGPLSPIDHDDYSPQTSDGYDLNIWLALLLMSVSALLSLTITRARRRRWSYIKKQHPMRGHNAAPNTRANIKKQLPIRGYAAAPDMQGNSNEPKPTHAAASRPDLPPDSHSRARLPHSQAAPLRPHSCPRARLPLYSLFIMIFAALACLAAANTVSAMSGYSRAQGEYAVLRQYSPAQSAPASPTTRAPAPSQTAEPPPLDLSGINADYVGWIRIDGTAIDYPVAQGDDNTKYLGTTFMNERNSSGAIFMDYRCKDGFDAPITILYGHNMRDGSMFAGLNRYLEDGYLSAHPTITVLTPSGETIVYSIFSILHTSARDGVYALPGGEEQALRDYMAALEAPGADRRIVLSTCTTGGDDSERLLVFGAAR